jgi:hypothetical protein
MSSPAAQFDLFAPSAYVAAAASSRFAIGELKERIDLPPPMTGAAAVPIVRPAVSAERRDWAERMIVAWSRRADEIRREIARGEGGRGAANRLFGLEWHVRRLWSLVGAQAAAPAAGEASQLPPAPIAPAVGEGPVAGGAIAAELARLRASLESWQERFDDRVGAVLNRGPISAEIRAQLQAKIDALEGTARG